MELNALDIKLGEWAGFTPDYCEGKVMGWTYPNQPKLTEGRFHINSVPDFTESLDACFKWLVPMLGEHNIILNPSTVEGSHYCHILLDEYPWEVDSFGHSYPEALCLAIEKLIDGS